MHIRASGLTIFCMICCASIVFSTVGYTARLATEEKNVGSTTRQAVSPAAEPTIHLNFRDVDLRQIIQLMSELTGKNFLIDDKVRGKITIVAPNPVTPDEAYQVFLSILEIQGFTVVPQGPIVKIIPSRDVKDSPIPTRTESGALSSTSDEFITQLIPLQHADANDIRGLLTPLVSKESSLLSYPSTNTLILTDTVSNITRLLKIIRALDIESPAAIFRVATLKHASAEQLAGTLKTALEGLADAGGGGGAAGADTGEAPQPGQPVRARRATPGGGGQRSAAAKGARIIPDTRTNSLVLIATRSEMNMIEDLLTKLDVPTPEGLGQIHVYYLAHANAEELAQVLTAQVSDITRPSSPSGAQDGAQRGLTQPGGAAGTSTGTQTRRSTPQTQGVRSGTTASGVTITADKPTNSLVIVAPPEAYAVIKEIIQKLDIRRSQVLVESLIAEITLDKTNQLGVEWRIIDEPGATQVFGSSLGSGATGLLGNALTPAGALAGLTAPGFLIGALRNTISFNGQDFVNIPALIRAFQSDSDVNILATPNLLTTDNQEAEIIIGEQRPFTRQVQDTPSGGVVSTSRSFEFKDVGITLRMTPQISQGKTVRLKLEQEITAFVSEAEVGAVTTTKRAAKTTVIVDDNQTIVIGGLIQQDKNEAKTQVPCLGNIPILGWAFRQTAARKRKTNLLIFITPHIVSTPEDINRVTTHKRLQSGKADEIEQELRDSQPHDNLELLLN